MKYSWWQYPIIYFWLLKYLIRIKFKVRALVAWRQEIGLIPKGRKPNLSDALSFGHWAVGQSINEVWGKKG